MNTAPITHVIVEAAHIYNLIQLVLNANHPNVNTPLENNKIIEFCNVVKNSIKPYTETVQEALDIVNSGTPTI